jgi:hypothetical protein
LGAIIVGLVGQWHELLLQFVEHNFSWITGCIVPGSGFGNLLARLKKLDRLPWHHCRNFLFVHELRMRVPLQYDAELIEPSNDPLQPNTIYQKDGDRRVVFEDMIQKHVLNVLRLFRSHEYPRSAFWSRAGPVRADSLKRSDKAAEMP